MRPIDQSISWLAAQQLSPSQKKEPPLSRIACRSVRGREGVAIKDTKTSVREIVSREIEVGQSDSVYAPVRCGAAFHHRLIAPTMICTYGSSAQGGERATVRHTETAAVPIQRHTGGTDAAARAAPLRFLRCSQPLPVEAVLGGTVVEIVMSHQKTTQLPTPNACAAADTLADDSRSHCRLR